MLNQYPVKTTVDGAILRNCRLVSEDGHTVLWQWDRATGQASILRRLDTMPERIGATQTWQVADLLVEPQRGCGCQHPMYTFVPPVGP